MRKILFRGKRSDTGEWVEGLPFYDFEMTISGIEAGITSKDLHDIIPETLGQYTGLKDKNGKRIFEGDIVRYTERQLDGEDAPVVCPVGFEEGGFCVHHYFLNNWLRNAINGNIQLEDIEAIGNIHDNQELMEGKA